MTAMLLAAVVAIGCSGKESRDDVLAQDTSLIHDLALANQDTISTPQLADVPVAAEPAPIVSEPAPIVSEPAPAPRTIRQRVTTPAVKKPAPRVTSPVPAPEKPAVTVTASGNTETVTPSGSEKPLGVISSGSEISLAAGQRVCTNTNTIGEKFTAQISNAVIGANGTVIPVGSTAVVSITSLKKSENSGDNIEIGLRVESISYGGKTYPVSSEVTYAEVDKVRAESRGDDAKKVATGAAIGAVLGQIFGHRTKSTVIGAAGGAAAGAIVAGRNANYDGCVPSGGRITIRLTQPLTVQATE